MDKSDTPRGGSCLVCCSQCAADDAICSACMDYLNRVIDPRDVLRDDISFEDYVIAMEQRRLASRTRADA